MRRLTKEWRVIKLLTVLLALLILVSATGCASRPWYTYFEPTPHNPIQSGNWEPVLEGPPEDPLRTRIHGGDWKNR
jgi:hypothetical protein